MPNSLYGTDYSPHPVINRTQQDLTLVNVRKSVLSF